MAHQSPRNEAITWRSKRTQPLCILELAQAPEQEHFSHAAADDLKKSTP